MTPPLPHRRGTANGADSAFELERPYPDGVAVGIIRQEEPAIFGELEALENTHHAPLKIGS